MKNKILYLLQIIIIASCKNSNTPIHTLEKMKTELEKSDYRAMRNYLCETDKKGFDKILSAGETAGLLAPKLVKEFINNQLKKKTEFKLEHSEFKNQTIDGNTATVDVYNNAKEKTSTIRFVKEGDDWKMCVGISGSLKDALLGK